MEKRLEKIVRDNYSLTMKGQVASYIPALKRANREDIGLSFMELDGCLYEAGKSRTKFTIQSISKVIALMQALMDNGEAKVFERVGYEGTDEPFNTQYKLDISPVSKPANPMINSGALVTTGLIKGDGEEKFNKVLELTRKMANNPKIGYNEEVYLSEKSTGDKNKSIAYLLKAKGLITGDVDQALDAYFKQCSIEVDTRDLANIATYLARGCNGLFTDKISKERLTSLILGIMTVAGMYNFSGQYLAKVGIPSKSGVAGGIMAVVPGKIGIGVYGPALDKYGNSSAGYGIMKDLSKEFNLKLF